MPKLLNSPLQKTKEGSAEIFTAINKKISKKLPVFYNPIMKFNRDISILFLNSIEKKQMNIALPLAATGIRGIRFILELNKNKIKNISFNDNNKYFPKIIKHNLKLNNIKNNKIDIYNKDANQFLLESSGFDYIDIDPFGSPNIFLDTSIKRLARKALLAVTATDTAPLAGTYPKTCLRKYWAKPLRNELKHEIGLRILIRKLQLIGSQYNKALIPVFSFYKDHYFRVFLKCIKSKKEADKLLEKHNHFENSGPMWIGNLWDYKLVSKMYNNIKENNKELTKFLKTIKEEAKINTLGFYDIHEVVKKYKIKKIPKKEFIIKKIKMKGYKAASTHFNGNSIRSDICIKDLIKIIKSS